MYCVTQKNILLFDSDIWNLPYFVVCSFYFSLVLQDLLTIRTKPYSSNLLAEISVLLLTHTKIKLKVP